MKTCRQRTPEPMSVRISRVSCPHLRPEGRPGRVGGQAGQEARHRDQGADVPGTPGEGEQVRGLRSLGGQRDVFTGGEEPGMVAAALQRSGR